ncbi:right-handed parallel beta-helix repeat-containing protein [Bacillus sp. ISL-7]|uniref:right-handed parallel beta-helix repeat-containing protein n=1 Tax=Bacillus sp. ISL-7 TaxID=2819136 RepID=UPI001BEADC05|nr:right-handed parallel beta-helix repeat-containing protein [Bacillus sp. ISL-7]MBT2736170.1 right-handed parallel beta-helix repeat-containing protein [Bacillus sp. ISL-7]
MPLQAISGEIRSQMLNDNFSFLDGEKIGKGNLPFFNVKDSGAIGDGVADDTVIIQSALDKASTLAFPSKVVIPAGTYKLTAELLIKKNTYLELHPNAVLKRSHNGNIIRNYRTTDSFAGYNGNGNIVIDGGTFDCNGANFTTTCNGIALAHAEHIQIRNITIKDVVNGHAIEATGIRHWSVRNSKFLGYKDTDTTHYYNEAIQVELTNEAGYVGNLDDYTPSHFGVVEGCYFANSGTSGFSPYPCGVGAHGAAANIWYDYISVINNTFEACSYWAVRPFKWSNAIVQGNKMKNCAGGVYVANPATGSESAKDSNGVGQPAQPTYNVIIVENIMTGLTGDGIKLEGQSDAYITRMKVADNVMDSLTGRGVYMKYVSHSMVEGNVINGATNNGMFIDYCASIDFNDNRISNVNFYGFNIAGTNTALTFINNRITNPSQATDNQYDGFIISNGNSDVRLNNNRVRTESGKLKARYGCNIQTGVTGVVRFGNDFKCGAGTASLIDTSTTPVTSSSDVV